MDAPWSKLTKAQQNVILNGVEVRHGAGALQESVRTAAVLPDELRGRLPFLRRRHTDAESDWAREQVEGYMREVPCPACGGARLRPASLAVTIDGRNITDLCSLSHRRVGEGARVPRALRA